jgi:hypothetical protein
MQHCTQKYDDLQQQNFPQHHILTFFWPEAIIFTKKAPLGGCEKKKKNHFNKPHFINAEEIGN